MRTANTGPIPTANGRRRLQVTSGVARRGMTVTVVAAGAVTAPGNSSSAGTRRHRGQVVPRTPKQVLVAVIQRNGSVRSVAAGDEVVVVKMLWLQLLLLMVVTVSGSVGNLCHDKGATTGKMRRAEGFCVTEGGRSERGGEDGVDSGRTSAPHRHGTISLFPSATVTGCTVAGVQHDSILADDLA